MRRLFSICFCASAISVNAAVPPVPGQATAVSPVIPRYQFAVAEELVYREESHQVPVPGDKSDTVRTQRDGRWQVWIVRRNSDGSWRILLDHQVRLVILRPKRKPEESIANRMLAWCDMFPDGRVVPNVSLGDSFYFQVNPSSLFVPLPGDQKAIAAGWTVAAAVGERTFLCSIDAARRANDRRLVINCTEHEPSQAAYAAQKTRRAVIDMRAGRLLEFEEDELFSTDRRHWHERTTVKLESVSQKPSAWMAQLERQANQYFAVRADYDKRVESLVHSRTAEKCKVLLGEGRALLSAAEKTSTLEPIRAQYVALLKLHDRDAEMYATSARRREELYARGPADWELTDFEGKKHQLKDYRGKVVVLDYWYRGCHWCTKALPQIDEVAHNYRGKPVAVLGMNIDVRDDDARFVIREMGLHYPNLKATSTEKTYFANQLGYPVLYVLDQTGRVRDIHEGYSADLAKRTGESVERLLRVPAAQAQK